MEVSKIPPLQTLNLKSRPASPHALSWSCDAELAVATVDGIYIYLPQYPHQEDEGPGGGAMDYDAINPQFSLFVQTTALLRPNPAVNSRICHFAGLDISSLKVQDKGNSTPVVRGSISGSAAAIGHVIRVEWSPNTLGRNQRPILTAMTTHGQLLAFGEDFDTIPTVGSSYNARSFKNWKNLWGLGVDMPLPASDPQVALTLEAENERVTSFAWAKAVRPSAALLALLTNDGDVKIMAVQFIARSENGTRQGWRIEQMYRFNAKGPHSDIDTLHPDYTPHGSTVALNWSPWLTLPDGSHTSTLSYIAKDYVGFRKITITGEWLGEDRPSLKVEDKDTTGICTALSSDAFLEWEDAVWEEENEIYTARGIICTPFNAKPFYVNITDSDKESSSLPPHTSTACASTYSDETDMSTNPIIGLIIHHPDLANKPEVPDYTLVRLSATASNEDWFQTTLPEEVPLPQWAEDIAQRVTRQVPRGMAMRADDSDSDDDVDEDVDEEGEEEEDTMVLDEDVIQVRPHSYRFWGIAASPGDGTTVVLVSRHQTQYPDRKGSSKVLFGWYVAEDSGIEIPKRISSTRNTTEGRAWEWMYGNGQEVPGTTVTKGTAQPVRFSQLREQFQLAIEKIKCVFCASDMHIRDNVAICSEGHEFLTCVASGLPIMAPGISRVCGVCNSRCLNSPELEKIAQEYLTSDRFVVTFSELCGGCGGKFII